MASQTKILKNLMVLTLIIIGAGFQCFMWQKPVWALETSPVGFDVELNLQNNLVNVADIFSPSYENTIKQRGFFPSVVTAAGSLNLQYTFEKTGDTSIGCFVRKEGWLLASGETAHFFHDAADANFTTPKAYNLDVDSENYSLIGSFLQKKFDYGGFQYALEEDFFICFDYHSLKASGVGLLNVGTDKINVYSSYELGDIDHNRILGFGGSLSWQVAAKFGWKTELKLHIRNLPGLIYFPSLTSENGIIDSSLENISPISLNGSTADNPKVLLMPIETEGSFSIEVFNGKAELQVFGIGYVYYLSIGYRYPLNGGWDLEAVLDPVNGKIGLGCSFPNGEFMISLNSQSGWMNDGVNFL